MYQRRFKNVMICEKWAHLSCSGKDDEGNTTIHLRKLFVISNNSEKRKVNSCDKKKSLFLNTFRFYCYSFHKVFKKK